MFSAPKVLHFDTKTDVMLCPLFFAILDLEDC